MSARIDHHVEEGLARRQGQRVVFARDLLENLRRRELETVAARVTAETGLAYQAASAGEHVAGIYRQRVTLASGRFAMIDDWPRLQPCSLVPNFGTPSSGNRFRE